VTAKLDIGGRFCGRARHGISSLSAEDMRQIEAHRAKHRPTPWQALARRYNVNELDLRQIVVGLTPAHRPEQAASPVVVHHEDPPELIWSPRRVAILKRMWCLNSCTTAEIAEVLKISAEAVVGKIRRLNLDKGQEAPIPNIGSNALAIIDATCARYGVTRAQIIGPSSRRCYSVPRSAAMYEVREKSGYPLERIASMFGGRHHTTVLEGIRKHELRLLWSDIMVALACAPEPLAVAA
jgi:hypothetical protein